MIPELVLFLSKAVIIVVAILAAALGFFVIARRDDDDDEPGLKIRKLNDRYTGMREALASTLLSKKESKQKRKERKKERKAEKKSGPSPERKRVFVLDFKGDTKASGVSALRDEVTAILTGSREGDEVFVRLESPGGQVHGYGLAASQLARLREQNVPLTIAVDKVAASGGYMMACVANTIIAAPFAVVGSIGVVAQLPNFHRYLKERDIDVELFTAGEHKRSVTMFGDNTEEDRAKLREDLEEIHDLFKSFVSQYRPQLDIAAVANGDTWYGTQAIDNALIDAVQTSDDWLLDRSDGSDLYHLSCKKPKGLREKLLGMGASLVQAKTEPKPAHENRYFL